MGDLKERAAPKNTEMTIKLDMLYKEQVISNIILADILQSKADQAEVVVLWQLRCEEINKAKSRGTWMQVFIGVAALSLAGTVFYLEMATVNKDNPIVQFVAKVIGAL